MICSMLYFIYFLHGSTKTRVTSRCELTFFFWSRILRRQLSHNKSSYTINDDLKQNSTNEHTFSLMSHAHGPLTIMQQFCKLCWCAWALPTLHEIFFRCTKLKTHGEMHALLHRKSPFAAIPTRNVWTARNYYRACL